MVADLFHYGHITFLKNIKNKYKCNIIVGLHTDEDVMKYKREPIMTYNERKIVLESCKYVDNVIECPLNINLEFLKLYNIDIMIHAHDIEEHEKYKFLWGKMGDKFIREDYTKGISTTDIIKRVIDRYNTIHIN